MNGRDASLFRRGVCARLLRLLRGRAPSTRGRETSTRHESRKGGGAKCRDRVGNGRLTGLLQSFNKPATPLPGARPHSGHWGQSGQRCRPTSPLELTGREGQTDTERET